MTQPGTDFVYVGARVTTMSNRKGKVIYLFNTDKEQWAIVKERESGIPFCFLTKHLSLGWN